MSENKVRPFRRAKNKAIVKIDQAITEERKFRKKRMEEKKHNRLQREDRKKLVENEGKIHLKKRQEEEERIALRRGNEYSQTLEEDDLDLDSEAAAPSIAGEEEDDVIGTPRPAAAKWKNSRGAQINNEDASEVEVEAKANKKREITPPPFECIICSEEILGIVERAEKQGKGGIDGGLSIWSCDQRDCGSLFCISSAIQYINRGATLCPACRRDWDIISLRIQARIHDPDLLYNE